MQDNLTQNAAIGVLGLGVMGKSLALNIADNGYKVGAFDLDQLKVQATVAQAQKEFSRADLVIGYDELSALLNNLNSPRILLLSIPAGPAVDRACEALLAAGLTADDIVVDTGNSLWTDTVAREQKYQGQFHFFSSAVSGGEQGARFGPCLMPSGDAEVWQQIAPIWQAMAAKVDPDTGLPFVRNQPGQTSQDGEPCAAYMGPGGAGHYVKMVHNGIEYADMQLICEAYHLLSAGLGLRAADIAEIFKGWDQGPLNSYLMEISADILTREDPETKQALVELILDKAGQKGTGLWTAVSSLELGAPAPTIAEAVFARALSNQQHLRQTLSQQIQRPVQALTMPQAEFIDHLESALLCAKVSVYAQGFQLMAMNAKEQGWTLEFANIARIWRAGCIIRAGFLQHIVDAYQQNPALEHMFTAPLFAGVMQQHQQSWRQVVAQGVMLAIPMPCISSALSYFDSYCSAQLPANLLQAQRDYFGAHTVQRIDKPADESYHFLWEQQPSVWQKM